MLTARMDSTDCTPVKRAFSESDIPKKDDTIGIKRARTFLGVSENDGNIFPDKMSKSEFFEAMSQVQAAYPQTLHEDANSPDLASSIASPEECQKVISDRSAEETTPIKFKARRESLSVSWRAQYSYSSTSTPPSSLQFTHDSGHNVWKLL